MKKKGTRGFSLVETVTSIAVLGLLIFSSSAPLESWLGETKKDLLLREMNELRGAIESPLFEIVRENEPQLQIDRLPGEGHFNLRTPEATSTITLPDYLPSSQLRVEVRLNESCGSPVTLKEFPSARVSCIRESFTILDCSQGVGVTSLEWSDSSRQLVWLGESACQK